MFSSRFADMLSSVANEFLQHRCTLVRRVEVPNEETEGGHPVYTNETVSDVRCLLLWKEETVTDDRGNVVTRTPSLYLLASEVVSEGDIVQNVLTSRGVNILESAKINTIDSTAEGGDQALKVAVLEGATV